MLCATAGLVSLPATAQASPDAAAASGGSGVEAQEDRARELTPAPALDPAVSAPTLSNSPAPNPLRVRRAELDRRGVLRLWFTCRESDSPCAATAEVAGKRIAVSLRPGAGASRTLRLRSGAVRSLRRPRARSVVVTLESVSGGAARRTRVRVPLRVRRNATR